MQKLLRFQQAGTEIYSSFCCPRQASLFLKCSLAYETCHPLIWTGLPLSSVSPYPLCVQGLVSNYTWKAPKEVVNQQTLTLKQHAAIVNMRNLTAERFLHREKIKQDVNYLYTVALYGQVYVFPFLCSSINLYVNFNH